VPDDHHAAAAKARKPAKDRPIVPECAIAGEGYEVIEQQVDIVGEMWPLGVTGDLRLLPRCELGVGLAQQLVGARFEASDLVSEVELRAAASEVAQLLDLSLQLADRLFEFEQFRSPPLCGNDNQPALAAI
jgi:hypothetical protein